ncbi:hypothetical protein OROGR_013314 [Orobanche gracilis]
MNQQKMDVAPVMTTVAMATEMECAKQLPADQRQKQ